MSNKVFNKISSLRASYLYRYSPYSSALADLPADLFPYFQRTASLEFKGIPRDAFFFARAAEGLMMFFDCVRRADGPCALPSAAADALWHAWIRLDPAHLRRFTMRHFGRAIAHTEQRDMTVPMASALANSLAAAGGPDAPLFCLDQRLGMRPSHPDGSRCGAGCGS